MVVWCCMVVWLYYVWLHGRKLLRQCAIFCLAVSDGILLVSGSLLPLLPLLPYLTLTLSHCPSPPPALLDLTRPPLPGSPGTGSFFSSPPDPAATFSRVEKIEKTSSTGLVIGPTLPLSSYPRRRCTISYT
ncbi:hypothetical protein F4820DRAFT_349346 [Hypoxylon rubiginosum]|uniref:Uncharacterized protein n=1 Tax=Hypoxylon rubiginosum TaxID=110542 RepID=A0ACB9YXA4_9PEZI|nr:hypothetical protein F4820DRAFT_349346 [Hypoxylon rubiginosum]